MSEQDAIHLTFHTAIVYLVVGGKPRDNTPGHPANGGRMSKKPLESCTLCGNRFSDWFVWEGERYCLRCRQATGIVYTENRRAIDPTKEQTEGRQEDKSSADVQD